LVVGHGSRDPRGAKEFHELIALIRARNPDLAVGGGFIELSRPPISECVNRLIEGGSREISAVPLMLLGAGHAKDDIPATLAAANAPCTVNSFLSLAEQGFFDDTPCPRITNFPSFGILQCGDPTGTTTGGPGYRFDDELSGEESYPAGTIAMANSGPGTGTNGSQFFLVYRDTDLTPDYTVFGRFGKKGVDIIQTIADEGDDGSNQAGGGVPNKPINITGIQR
jgi:cyclophilin family peptidyl-prolyl cis-trans isomerase